MLVVNTLMSTLHSYTLCEYRRCAIQMTRRHMEQGGLSEDGEIIKRERERVEIIKRERAVYMFVCSI